VSPLASPSNIAPSVFVRIGGLAPMRGPVANHLYHQRRREGEDVRPEQRNRRLTPGARQ